MGGVRRPDRPLTGLPRTLYVAVPGDIATRTGGYGYDREIVAALGRRGWTVHVVTLSGTYPEPSAGDLAATAHQLGQLPDDACVMIDGLACGVLADVLAPERARLRLVALVHHPLGLETGLDAASSRRLLASERAALACVRLVVVTSRRTVGAVETLDVAVDRIVVVEPGTEPAPLAHGSREGAVQMLCVASLVPRKGHDLLFDALERLTHAEWHLTCAGSADRDVAFASMLVRRSATGLLRGRVTLAGELAGDALESAYASSDLFVLPTRYEGYGMAVAEALARGIPVVSTRTGAIDDLVGDSAGVLVPTDDASALASALEPLLADRARLDRFRSGAMRVRSALPTWDVSADAMERALATVIGG
jgi:glycosyltransferase involved in cell wall biosynthesis